MEMEKHTGLRLVCIVAVIAGVLPLAGCVIVNSGVDCGEKGAPLSADTLEQIEPGQTTRDWVIATLGEPSEQSTAGNGVEVLTYRYSCTRHGNLVMPFLIINDEKRDAQTVYFEISDGVVQKYWTDCDRDGD
jgi:outer membrane protein assembly factor BamE (lipoprotein component of BamABCDE complex)